jgi:hypothetical protein
LSRTLHCVLRTRGKRVAGYVAGGIRAGQSAMWLLPLGLVLGATQVHRDREDPRRPAKSKRSSTSVRPTPGAASRPRRHGRSVPRRESGPRATLRPGVTLYGVVTDADHPDFRCDVTEDEAARSTSCSRPDGGTSEHTFGGSAMSGAGRPRPRRTSAKVCRPRQRVTAAVCTTNRSRVGRLKGRANSTRSRSARGWGGQANVPGRR